MIVTIINSECIRSISLPQKITGQYWLYDDREKSSEKLVSIEGVNNEWILKSNRRAKIVSREGTAIKETPLLTQNIYAVKRADSELVYVFAEAQTDDRQIFTKYYVGNSISLSVGRSNQNDICFESNAASSNHFSLNYANSKWKIKDTNSTNGTFVNEQRVSDADLSFGDLIYAAGLKIVVGKDFLAVNNPDGKVTISDKLKRIKSQEVIPAEDDEYELSPKSFFYRSPRFKREIETDEFKIDAPPSSPIADEMPWPLVMGSSMAMGMMSLVTLISAVAAKNVTSMVMGGSMLLGTLLLPTITKIYERNRKRKKEKTRQEKYREYLSDISKQIDEACRYQEQVLKENIVPIEECESRILELKRNLWDRTKGQSDFLRVRIGSGEGMLDAKISYQERKFSIDEDNLLGELYSLCEAPKLLHDIPIAYSIFDNFISGVIGNRYEVKEFAKGLIVQLSALYSYDEVKFVFLYDRTEAREFEFVKWLPHVWNADKTFRFLATDNNEVKEVSAYLENVIAERKAMNSEDLSESAPYYIVFSMDKNLASRSDMFKQLLNEKSNINFSIITFYDELKDLPKECMSVIELTGARGRLFDKNDTTGKSTEFIPDIYPTKDTMLLSTTLADIFLDNADSNYALPKMITFLEMFGVGKVEHLNALTRWKENDPTKTLEAAVGVDTYGELFKLDLHEKFHGPHGLVAGMTGSGKSEFIITYILSLAVNYHPNEVAFILIDYKGGGMAKSFENLPHTAGIITNLDGAAIKRSLVSIESELKRRQAIFAEASKQIGVSNIDIYKYQKLFREGRVTEPLQHLFIISDEFAELKTQQPEFMTQLVSAARIGRSLGVHLILATQKPSGVVDDQIWSNSKFRVCLKVQERADSMDMLKRPDAAELKDTGRFYLQVGYNELFEMGQSAWAGAPYYPSEKAQKEKDNSVIAIDNNGRPIKEVKIDNKKSLFGDPQKQLDVITTYLGDIAKEEGIKVRPLWLEPIPAKIYLDELKKKYGIATEPYVLNPLIGEYDDPARQLQAPLTLPLSTEGNVVVYGAAGCGKTTFLNALIVSLITEHSPDEVNLYLLDFAAETLRAFSRAPHVGDVILAHESEKVGNLCKMLYSELQRRKKEFADFGGDYSSYIKTSGKTAPSIVVAVNNFAAFTESYPEREDAIALLSREGVKYGIYFVLTSLGTGGVKFRMLQNFKQLLTLQLNDESDYSTVVGKTEGLYPSKYKGRGLIKRDNLYEFQIAYATQDEVPYSFLQRLSDDLGAKWNGESAKRVPILPDNVDIEFIKEYLTGKGNLNLPIGVEKSSLDVHRYPFDKRYINMVLSSGNEYQEFISKLSELIGRFGISKGTVFDVPRSIKANTGEMRVASTAAECNKEISDIFDTVLYRNNTYKDALESGQECEKFDRQVVIINSLSMLKDVLDDTGNEKLSLILEKGSVEYNIFIILGDQAKYISSINFEKWYKANGSTQDGIWIGNGFADQYQLKPNKVTSEHREEISAEFGYSVVAGKSVRVKVLSEKKEADNDYE